MTSYPTFLAIDFGTKRIGLAISRGTLAEPLKIIANDEHAIANIAEVCHSENVSQLVVGLSENEMAELTRAFVVRLSEQVQLPVEYMDETLSSHTVGGKLKDLGVPLAKRQQPIDHLAAALFLQEYLDMF